MPEGPEIRRAADRLERALLDRPLTSVFFAFPDLAAEADALVGQCVTAVDTRGKALLTRFDGGLTMYSHNQLYGRWYVMRSGRQPKTGRSLRVALHNDRHSALLYSASDVALLDAEGLAAHPFLGRLGPDILERGLTPEAVAERLAADPFRRRSLASLYLDQGFLAGNGNYLRSEVLFFAGLRPQARPVDLDAGQRARLARVTLTVARRSYRTGGITNPPSRVAALKEQGLRRGALRFAVFGRADRPCFECGTPIERVAAAGRRLYFCPRCQAGD
jgi:endonuclease-8